MFTNFSILPLRMAILLGLCVGVLGFALASYTVFEKYHDPNLPVGWATLMIVTCMFSGAQLISIGLLGEYLGRLFLSMNKSPQFTVRNEYLRE
jgi:hypothetical protein